jgi:hypothetical protein
MRCAEQLNLSIVREQQAQVGSYPASPLWEEGRAAQAAARQLPYEQAEL